MLVAERSGKGRAGTPRGSASTRGRESREIVTSDVQMPPILRRFLIHLATERGLAQNTIDAYCNPSGASSVKQAIEADRTLGGAAHDLRVTDMRNVSSMSIADTTYLTAEFVVQVYAQ